MAQNGYWFIQNNATGLYLEIPGGVPQNVAVIQNELGSNDPTQQWFFKTYKNTFTNQFQIQNRATQKALTVLGSAQINGLVVIQTDLDPNPDPTSPQLWWVQDFFSGDPVKMQNQGSQKFLDMPTSDKQAGVAAVQWDWNQYLDNRYWTLTGAPS
jgi:ricin-type beta-trefoil lectin protein